MRFLFLTDTHIGAGPADFHQQPAYPDRLEELLDEIKSLARAGHVDFVLHGGDMVHQCTPELISEAKRLFHLPVPVYLSQGNHDLNRQDAVSLWLKLAPEFFPGQKPQYTIYDKIAALHVMPSQWEPGVPYYWDTAQDPYLTEEQLSQLEAEIRLHPDKVHLLSVHNPVFGIPKEQTGYEETIHDVPDPFRQIVLGRMRAHNMKCVLSGHNHANTLKQTYEGVFATGSSFVETPFDYKIVEVSGSSLRISTRSVDGPFSFTPEYDETRTYIQGSESIRTLEWTFRS
ncbi:hypothetical protein SD71_07235 [Cohnella kolymensis]|uniref:Calcineurin-like phosphoesterase domain-containing protein n=1 Tax=Cohnella kolymensis TaxID=1590652 RepID=A0ABR5A682_9BACL|nr:metallophosphoesterase [Cohnella kolymensis]KIL36542.1 hypothetical protein SD71_07235 [Cohnella kolymensis]